jgi:hypothetical protein
MIARLLGAWLLFSAGQWMFMVASSVFAFQVSGAGGVSVVAIARLVPAMLAAPLAGVLVDRFDRARVVTIGCLLQSAALAAGVIAVVSGRSLAGLVAATVVVSAAGSPSRPALQALLPSLARSPGELTRATAAWSAVDSVGFLLGAGVGGLLLAVVEPGTAIAVPTGLSALTTLLVVGLPANRALDDSAQGGRQSTVLAGLRAVRGTPALYVPFALFAGLLLLEGSSDVQLVDLALDRLPLGSGGPGLLYAVWGAGGLLGSGALLWLVRRAGYGRALLVGAVSFGVLLGVSGVDGIALAVAAMIPVGVGYSLVESAMMGVIPRLADDAVIGRVYGICEVLHAGVAALGALMAPLLIHAIGISASLEVVGLGYAACGVLAWRRCMRLDAGEQRAGRIRTLLHDVPFLAPLPLPQLERLVRSAQGVTVAAGETVVRAGTTGDEFFVIDSGELDVVEYDRREGPGAGFGEIALLRDVPRTATVRAVVDTRLWAIGRGAFLAAVGAHDEVARAAHDVVAAHLSRPRPLER